jgi:hypothetical protein
MKNTSIMELLATWLLNREGLIVASHDVEVGVPRFIAMREGRNVNPSTISRQFRELRSDPQLLVQYGLYIEQVKGGKEGKWKISRRTMSLPSAASPIAA